MQSGIVSFIYTRAIVLPTHLVFYISPHYQGLPYWDWTIVYNHDCIIDNPYRVHDEVTEEDCSVCGELKKIKRVSNVSQSTIADDYLFSNVPVIVTDAMEEWDALGKFDIGFLAEVRSDCKKTGKDCIQAINQ